MGRVAGSLGRTLILAALLALALALVLLAAGYRVSTWPLRRRGEPHTLTSLIETITAAAALVAALRLTRQSRHLERGGDQ